MNNINISEMLLKDKPVMEEIHKHLWIESQRAGHSIGLERATEEWLTLYSSDWMKYNLPDQYAKLMKKNYKKK